MSLLLISLLLTLLPQQAVPPLTGRVVDRADVLSPQTEQILTTLLEQHEAATSNQIAVLTIPSLEGETVEDYALRVARAWALGTAEANNGVLLLVAVADRELRIEVGYGLEGSLPDALAGRIIRQEIVPLFRAGSFDGGVTAGVGAIIGALEGTYAPPQEVYAVPSADPVDSILGGLVFLVMASIFAVAALLVPGCVRWLIFIVLLPFFAAAGTMLATPLMPSGAEVGGLVLMLLYVAAFVLLIRHPRVKKHYDKVTKSWKARMATAGSSGGSSGSSWSSSSSGFSSSSSFGSSSSFSGGGGSFGGGGASGSW